MNATAPLENHMQWDWTWVMNGIASGHDSSSIVLSDATRRFRPVRGLASTWKITKPIG
jgi:hypothetical protein